MSDKARILYVCQELMPYLPESEMSRLCRALPQAIQEKGRDIRTFMPRYGCINERRNQLHEVIRLSGMNIVIDDTDHQLIIKVASIPNARLQVYFIDNEDYFQRKFILTDAQGNYFPDNDERAIFFARGVIETVSKLRWSPDIIHCHGWFSWLMPAYIKSLYSDDPLFASSKIVVSLYDNTFPGALDAKFREKLESEGFDAGQAEILAEPAYENLLKYTLQFTDGIIVAGKEVNEDSIKYAGEQGIEILSPAGDENYIEEYNDFYEKILSK